MVPAGGSLREEDKVDYAIQRKNMVESQVRPSDVTDRRIIRAMLDVPRELFVPEALRATVYMDGDVRLAAEGGAPRFLLAPRVFAKALQLAALNADDHVLVVGGLFGYAAAVASQLSRSVTMLECEQSYSDTARKSLAAAGVKTVTVVTGPLPAGWPADGPYDGIFVEGGITGAPKALLEQLKHGGRLVALRASKGAAGRAVMWTRVDGSFGAVEDFCASADVLPGFEALREFAL